MTDILYVVKRGEKNEELRYSLRSLRNFKHDRVFMAGYIPKWVQNVIPIPTRHGLTKQRSAERNLVAGMKSGIDDDFYHFNDDFFVMEETAAPPYYYRGTLEETIAKMEKSAYRNAMQKALLQLTELDIEDPLCYDTHSPFLMNKKKMDLVLGMRARQDCYLYKTIYGNLYGVGGVQHGNFKVRRGSGDAWKDWPFLSTSDSVFRKEPIGAYIREAFPEKGHYER